MNNAELLIQFDGMIDRLQGIFEHSRTTMNEALKIRNALVMARQKIALGCTQEELIPLLEIIQKAVLL
jgi:hypothetical protein